MRQVAETGRRTQHKHTELIPEVVKEAVSVQRDARREIKQESKQNNERGFTTITGSVFIVSWLISVVFTFGYRQFFQTLRE